MMSSMDQSSPWWLSAPSFRRPIQPVELHVPFHRNGVEVRPYVAGKALDDGTGGGEDTAVGTSFAPFVEHIFHPKEPNFFRRVCAKKMALRAVAG
jgi:hypothetical protein